MKKSVGRDLARRRSGPAATYVAPSASSRRREVRRRVGVGDRAADRAAVAHLRVADLARRRGRSSGTCCAQQVGRLDVVVAGQRADGDVVAGVADVRQVGEAADVDEHGGWARRSFISGSRRWPPARNLASSPCSPSEADRLFGRLGPDVVERGGDHWRAPPFAGRWPWMAAHTFCGHGRHRRRRVTPSADSASTMALMTAGAAPIVPASPMPLTPSGFVGTA